MPLAVLQTRGFETFFLELFCLFSLDGEPHPLECLVLLETIVALICKYFVGPSKPDCSPFLVLVEVEDVVVYC